MIRRPVILLLGSIAFLTPSGGFIAKSVEGKIPSPNAALEVAKWNDCDS